jgi:hypothetical protein
VGNPDSNLAQCKDRKPHSLHSYKSGIIQGEILMNKAATLRSAEVRRHNGQCPYGDWMPLDEQDHDRRTNLDLSPNLT